MKNFMVMGLTALLALAGCTTTPVARESANFGVGVIGEMEVALADFRNSETEAYKARQASLRDQHRLARKAMASMANSSRMRESAGDSQAQMVTRKLVDNSDAMAADQATLIEGDKLGDETIAALVTPLPNTRHATEEAQKAMALLGANLSAKAQYDTARSFIIVVKDTVSSNKAKIADAKKAAETDSSTN